jgi:D-psicose/D-tagatose/L-ribulose 3-epimerase
VGTQTLAAGADMRLGISNIAWDRTQDEDVALLLRRHGLDAIDVAHSKYFPDPRATSPERIAQVRDWWADRGIQITGMQALLFGTSGLNMFGTSVVREAMLDHLAAVCGIASGLGATRLTFGSPKNRDRSGLDDGQAMSIAEAFLRRLAGIAAAEGAVICLEPNPKAYGCNFMTTTEETARVVERVGHPAIRLQLDAGATQMNGEDMLGILDSFSHLVGHVHLSAPELAPIQASSMDHSRTAAALRRYLPDHLLTIEMLVPAGQPTVECLEEALELAVRCYG